MGGGFSTRIRLTQSNLPTDSLDHLVTEFLDDDWSEEEFEEEMLDALEPVCYAYGKLENLGEDIDQESGYLSQLQGGLLEDVKDSSEPYEWALEYLGDIATFASSFNGFSEDVTEMMQEVAKKAKSARSLAKFIPLFWSVRGICESGCKIRSQLERDKEVLQSTYITFLKYVALAIIEIAMLASGFGAAFSASYKSVGVVNRVLINRIGHRIGWAAYSRLLSVVHWGVRVIYAETIGKAIEDTIRAVISELVEASSLSKPKARGVARKDVRTVAKKADSDMIEGDFESWKANRLIARVQRDPTSVIPEWAPSFPSLPSI